METRKLYAVKGWLLLRNTCGLPRQAVRQGHLWNEDAECTLCFNTGSCPRALPGVSGVVCGINHLLKAIPLWEERKTCSVHVPTSFSLFVKKAAFPPVAGRGVPPRLSFLLEHWFPEHCVCSPHPGLGARGSSRPPGAGMGRVRCFVLCGSAVCRDRLYSLESLSLSRICFDASVLTLGVRSRMWHFKNPWCYYELFHLHMPLSPSVGNSPSEPFLFLPYAASSFSFSARNPVRHLISLCSSVQLKIDYCHLPMGWLSFYLVP